MYILYVYIEYDTQKYRVIHINNTLMHKATKSHSMYNYVYSFVEENESNTDTFL